MKTISFRDAIIEALEEEMARDEKVFIMGEDVAIVGGVYKTTRGLLEKFGPERVRNTPISEAAIVSGAVGAAMMGARPVAEIMYIDFTTMCMDPIVNQAAKIRYHTGGAISVPVVIRTQGGVGNSNGSQHSQSLEAWFVHTPGLKVVMPSTPYDAKGLLKAAIRDDGPVIFIEHKGLYTTKGQVPEGEYIVDLGKADIKRSGRDVTIVAYSRAVATALEAARILAEHGIEVEVVDPRSLVPLDIETIISSVRKTKRVVIVHEACERAGVGAELLAQIQEKAFDYLDAPIARVTGKNIPIPFAPNLEKASIPQVDNIVDAVRKILIGGK